MNKMRKVNNYYFRNLKEITNLNFKELAQDFELKGRSKIGAYDFEIFVKLMKEQRPEDFRILRQISKKYEKLVDKYTKISAKLQAPENPLKGRGYQRIERELTSIEYNIVNKNHLDFVTYRRQKGYFVSYTVISPEQNEILNDFNLEVRGLLVDYENCPFRIEKKKIEEKRLAEAKEKAKKERQSKIDEFRRNGTGDLLADFFKNEFHPAPAEVLKAKKQTGKSWSELREIYQ